MAGNVDPVVLKAALERWVRAMQNSAPELNELDGRLGDGDLGATLEKCAANVQAALPAMPASLDGIFKSCAQACAKASGSSFGTLLAQAFLGAAKWVGQRQEIRPDEMAPLLTETIATLSARGGAKLGDKTMLDSLDAIAQALAAAPADADFVSLTQQAARQALDAYRQRPNQIGRARMFAEKSIGLDDPGMVAVERMAGSLTHVASMQRPIH